MAQISNINIGSSANDGGGDSLRGAGQKINSNFAALNAEAGVAGRVISAAGNVIMNAADGRVIVKKTVPEITSVAAPEDMVAWRPYTVKDGALNASSYPITITPPAGMTFEGGQASMVINQDGWALSFCWDGGTVLYLV